ncbi:flagellin [Acutalibacter sp. JLR.KK004]|uniref:flagellin N-terminal helical domain-containing protein n=1 Tax=Acutalibacter sp. JLR.KK004 TaxID=3112622 RepID=UPI002FF38984
MRIQHNILAMNAYRNYNTNTSALAKNLEKLSSGYKINRAGDDAAGLAISEKMRAQITGLNAAQKNVKDGISLVKTAEGAMQEIQDMLNRMDYLATQSANGTYDNEVDRLNLQKEVDQLKSEINRIADSANFNGIKLLDGTQGASTATGGTAIRLNADTDAVEGNGSGQKGVYSIDISKWSGSAGSAAKASFSIVIGGVTIAKASISAGKTGDASAIKLSASSATINNVKFEVKLDGGKITLTMKSVPTTKFDSSMAVTVTPTGANATENNAISGAVKVETPAIAKEDSKFASATFALTTEMIKDGNQIKIGKDVYTFAVGKDSKFKGGNVIDLRHMKDGDADLVKEAGRALSKAAANNSWFKVTTQNDGGTIHLTEKFGADGSERPYKNNMVGTSTAKDADWNATGTDATKFVMWGKNGELGSSGGLTLQIGDTSDSYNQLNVVIGDMHTTALGIDSVDISKPESASAAIQTIKDAINYVSGVRGDLGATQNRLEHTANNLSVMAENIQDAESTIRDTDVAEEMMAYTKNNILIQSAQAMLAQANAVPQGVLQLLG